MSKKIPPDAFSYYYSLGPTRSFAAVGTELGVSKQAIAKVAKTERWQERTEEIDRAAQEKVDRRLAESVEEMGERHLRMLRVVQGKALETLKAMPLSTAMEAVRALDLTIRQERLIRGEPTDREELGIAEVVRRESQRWLVNTEESDAQAGD